MRGRGTLSPLGRPSPSPASSQPRSGGWSVRLTKAVTDLIEQGAPAFEGEVPILTQLLKAEVAEREVRSIAYHMKAARFPAYKDLSGFDSAT